MRPRSRWSAFDVRPGLPVPRAAAARLRDLVRQAAKDHGDARPDWIVTVRMTLARALAAAGPGSSAPRAGPATPVYLVLAEGSFRGAGGPAGFLYAIVDARIFSGYAQHLSGPGPDVPLSTLGRWPPWPAASRPGSSSLRRVGGWRPVVYWLRRRVAAGTGREWRAFLARAGPRVGRAGGRLLL